MMIDYTRVKVGELLANGFAVVIRHISQDKFFSVSAIADVIGLQESQDKKKKKLDLDV